MKVLLPITYLTSDSLNQGFQLRLCEEMEVQRLTNEVDIRVSNMWDWRGRR